MTLSNSSSLTSVTSPYTGDIPALLTSTSTWPNSAYAASASPSSSAHRPTCTAYGSARRPVAR